MLRKVVLLSLQSICKTRKANRSAWALLGSNCHQENILDAARYDIEPTQRRNTRSEGDKTYHLVISFRPGEKPSQEVLDAAEERICEAMGYADHQRVQCCSLRH